jgi:hypothetical protein
MTTHIAALSSVARALAFAALVGVPLASAAPINYGDVDDIAGGGTIYFEQVTESSVSDPTPLFGAPDAVVNRLDFDPLGFGASSIGGAPDLTDGQLNYSFRTAFGKGISSLVVEEAGDFSLLGAGTATTSLSYGLFAKVTILELGGVPVTPFTVIASTSFNKNLAANPGSNQPWSAGLLIELGPAIAANGFGTALVSRGEFVLDNTLIALSESGSVAFLAKKDIFITTTPLDDQNFIPEPASAALLAIGGLFAVRRRS